MAALSNVDWGVQQGEQVTRLPVPTGCRYVADPAVVAEVVDDQLILVQIRTGATFRLNQTGKTIWQLASTGTAEPDIVERLAAEFPIAQARLIEDTNLLLAALLRNQLLRPVTEALS